MGQCQRSVDTNWRKYNVFSLVGVLYEEFIQVEAKINDTLVDKLFENVRRWL